MSVYLDGRPDGRGRALILVHGAGGDHGLWDDVREHLRDRGLPSVALDLPGHGRSGGPPHDSVAAIADAVEDALGRAGVSAYVAAGHSLGGAVVLTLAACGAPGLAGVAAISTGARLPVDGRLLQGLGGAFEATVGRIVRSCFVRGTPPSSLERASRLMLATGAEVLHADFVACQAYGIGSGPLAAIAVPAAVVCGEDDVMTPPDLSQALARAIPAAHLELLPSCGHMPLLERPGPLAATLADLWGRAFLEA